MKFGEDKEDVFAAKSGFGGTEYLLPALVSEGSRRGLSYRRMAELTSLNPAQRYGLGDRKGRISVGYDADFASSTRPPRGPSTRRTPSPARSTPRSRASS